MGAFSSTEIIKLQFFTGNMIIKIPWDSWELYKWNKYTSIQMDFLDYEIIARSIDLKFEGLLHSNKIQLFKWSVWNPDFELILRNYWAELGCGLSWNSLDHLLDGCRVSDDGQANFESLWWNIIDWWLDVV